jgi:hypothetical protein
VSFDDDLFRRIGIRPKRHDPLRMGSKLRKSMAIATLAVGATILPLFGECVAVAKGQQRIQFYSLTKGDDGKHEFYVLGVTAFLTSGTTFTKSTLLPGWTLGQIEGIGSGANGAGGSAGSGGQGGHGGAYCKATNCPLPSGTNNYTIGAAGSDTTINSTTLIAKGGSTAPASQAAACRGGSGGGILGPGAGFVNIGGTGTTSGTDGGGGGGGGGSTGAGGNAAGRSGGSAGTGALASGQNAGSGAAGGTTFGGNGSPGNIYGGGGGAGAAGGMTAAGSGGSSGQGILSFSWTAAYGFLSQRRVRFFTRKF